MKKLFCTLLMMSTVLAGGCSLSADKMSVKSAKEPLEKDGFKVELLDETGAKRVLEGVTFEGLTYQEGFNAVKRNDAGEVLDALIAFYFKDEKEATTFLTLEDNTRYLVAYAQGMVGEEKGKIGTHNNVAYAGSDASIQTAGLTIEF